MNDRRQETTPCRTSPSAAIRTDTAIIVIMITPMISITVTTITTTIRTTGTPAVRSRR